MLTGVPAGNVRTLDALKKALEAGGVEFVGTPENRPGVRLRIQGQSKENLIERP